MATPQRQFPDERPGEPRREPLPVEERRIEERRVARSAAGGRSLFWIWIVLFIAAIIWFCGWGWGGYGGWWWGRTGVSHTMQPYTNGTGSGSGNGAAASTAAPGSAAPAGTAGPNGTASGTNSSPGNGGQAAPPAGNGAPPSSTAPSGSGQAPR